MGSSSKDYWLKFFLDAKIPKSAAEEYTLTFVENRIQSDMLLDLDKEYLNGMGITVMGDIIAILRHAKICHVQNAKKSMLSKQTSNTSLPSTSSADSNYRSVSLKKTPSPSLLKSNSKPSTNGSNSEKPKVIQSSSVKSKVSSVKPVIKDSLQTVRTKIVRDEKYVDKTISNGVKIKVEKEPSKPILVRTPLVRKRLSSEMTKTTVIDKHDESVSSGSDDETSEPVEEITRKMAKKSIFDRLGNPGQSKSSPVDSSERAVSSSTSPPVTSSSTLKSKNVPSQPEAPTRTPKPGTLSFRMFPPHVHSTSPDNIMDPLLDGDDRILVEIDQGTDGHKLEEDTPPPAPPSQVEYTVALPPDFVQPSLSSTLSKSSGGSVFDRLGGKNNGQLSSSCTTNPGKSILKLSSSSGRISKSSPTSTTTLVTGKRDIKTVSSLNNKLNLIRSQVKTEGVLGKPASLLNEKVSAKARIGNVTSTVPSAKISRNLSTESLRRNPSTESVRSNSSTTSSIRNRVALTDQTDKKPVISSRLDVLAKRTLSSTPRHVKQRIEDEQKKNLSKARCGSGIKARLGFKTEKDLESAYERRTKSLTPEKPEDILTREILTNDEEKAEMTLDGKKRVRFHCVEKKIIPHRLEEKMLQRRYSSPEPYNRYRARVW